MEEVEGLDRSCISKILPLYWLQRAEEEGCAIGTRTSMDLVGSLAVRELTLAFQQPACQGVHISTQLPWPLPLVLVDQTEMMEALGRAEEVLDGWQTWGRQM